VGQYNKIWLKPTPEKRARGVIADQQEIMLQGLACAKKLASKQRLLMQRYAEVKVNAVRIKWRMKWFLICDALMKRLQNPLKLWRGRQVRSSVHHLMIWINDRRTRHNWHGNPPIT